MEQAATGIMGHLRETTRALHKEAESRPLQRSMAKGTLPAGSYVMYLGQLRHLHESLEDFSGRRDGVTAVARRAVHR